MQWGRVKRIWYLSPMRAAKVQASLRIRAVSPEPPLLAHTSSESRRTFRQKARSLAPLNGWACAVKICSKTQIRLTRHICSCQRKSTQEKESIMMLNSYPLDGIFNPHLLIIKDSYRKFPKYSDTQKICCNRSKI